MRGQWSIGPKKQHEWLLAVDTLSASALPQHGLGLNHYASWSESNGLWPQGFRA